METHLRCEGPKGKVLKMDRPYGRRVLKFDGLSRRGLWWRLRRRFKKGGAAGAAGCVEGLCSLRSGGREKGS